MYSWIKVSVPVSDKFSSSLFKPGYRMENCRSDYQVNSYSNHMSINKMPGPPFVTYFHCP